MTRDTGTTRLHEENTVYGLQEALSRERCADLRRWSAQRRLDQQDAVARRWRRRRGAQSSAVARDARRDYELAGR